MSFKTVQARMAKKQGISKERAGAMLASKTRSIMKKHGMSTKHGIPKGVYKKMKGMSIHPEVNCNEAMRHQSLPIDKIL